MRNGIEIVEIGDAPQHRHGDGHRAVGSRPFVAETERVLRRQPRGFGKERQEAEGAPAGALADRRHGALEQARVAAELVDDEAGDGRRVLSRKRRLDAEKLGENAAAIDVADQRDRAFRGASKAHIGDVVVAQVELGCAARAFDKHEVGVRPHARVAVEHGAHELGFERLIFARTRVRRSPCPGRRPARRFRSAA